MADPHRLFSTKLFPSSAPFSHVAVSQQHRSNLSLSHLVKRPTDDVEHPKALRIARTSWGSVQRKAGSSASIRQLLNFGALLFPTSRVQNRAGDSAGRVRGERNASAIAVAT